MIRTKTRGSRLREILRAADRLAGAYLTHRLVEDTMHDLGVLAHGDYLVGVRADTFLVAECARADGTPVEIALSNEDHREN